MDLDLQQQVQGRLKELPTDVQQAIQSAEVQGHIREIGKRNNLHIDQVGKLEDEVYMVMLGFVDPGEFTANLTAELALAPAQAVSIAAEVTKDIFMPIRASMQEWAESHAAKQNADLVAHALERDAKPAASAASQIPIAPVSPSPTPPPAPVPAPKPAPDLSSADALLSEKRVATPPSAAPAAPETKPPQYKADPYREPV